jgi:membrane-associated protein
MMFDWIYWWAGRRWGRNAINLFVGNHPKAAARTARLEKIIHRFGWLAIVIAYFQPVPNVLIYAAAGWTRMRLRTFLILDLIGSLLWIALCVGLGYAIGQEAVDVAKAVSRYALWATIALVVVVIARQWWVTRRR